MAKLSDKEISVNQRVLDVYEAFRAKDATFTIAEFCSRTGMDASNWSKYKDSKHIFADQLVNLTNEFSINGHWLLTGVGRMFREGGAVEIEEPYESLESYRARTNILPEDTKSTRMIKRMKADLADKDERIKELKEMIELLKNTQLHQ